MMRIRNRDGFSLIEMMAVIAIVGVLASFILPSYISKMPHRRLQAAARELYGTMQTARQLAVKENRDSRLWFAGTYYYLDNNGNNVWDAGEKRVDLSSYHDVRFGNGSAAANAPGANNLDSASPNFSITFTPGGTVEPPGASNAIYLENISRPAESFAVIAQDSGAIKISWFRGTSGSVWR